MMKKFLSVLLSVLLVMTMFAGTQIFAASLSTVPGYQFDFNSLPVGYDLFGVSFSDGNPYRKDCTPKVGNPTSSIAVAEGNSAKMEGFAEIPYDDRWDGASTISFDLKNGSPGTNFNGFYLRTGAEGSKAFYENDGVRKDNEDSTTGTTGVGFSFRTNNRIEVFVKYYDTAAAALKVKGHSFTNVVPATGEFHNYKILDDGTGKMLFYADNTLFAQVTYANAKVPEGGAYAEQYYTDAKILDASGTVLESIANALISTQSTVVFGVRAETLFIDNIVFTDYTAPAVEKTISMEKTVFAPGEPIKVTYTGADKNNNDWLCIYEGAESTYGEQGGPISSQYAYIDGNGTVVFNDPDQTVEGNDRSAVLADQYDFSVVNYNKGAIEQLPVGTYHVLILGKGEGSNQWYKPSTDKIIFTVSDNPIVGQDGSVTQLTSDQAQLNDAGGSVPLIIEENEHKNFGSIEAGDSVEYKVDFTADGKYRIDIPVASYWGQGGIELSLDGTKVGEILELDAMEDWHNYKAYSLIFETTAGTHTIKLLFTEAGMNVKAPALSFSEGELPPVETWNKFPMAEADDKTPSPANAFVMDKGQYYAVQFNAASKFKGIEFQQWTPGGGEGKIDFTVSVYKWNKDYDTTVKGTPEASIESETTGDGGVTIDFGKEIAAGEYLIVIRITEVNEKAAPGMHLQSGKSLNGEDSYFKMYTDAGKGSFEGRFATLQLIAEGEASAAVFTKLSGSSNPSNPPTGENGIYLAIALLVIGSAAVAAVYRRKQENI